MPRKFVAAANWKNQCNVAKVADVVGILNGLAKDTDFDAVEVIVAPAFVHLQGVVSAIEDKNIKVASQNIADMDGLGAFTGQITAEVVKGKQRVGGVWPWTSFNDEKRRMDYDEAG